MAEQALSPGVAQQFVVVRPYPDYIRRRVFEFLMSLGFESTAAVEPGVSDSEAAEQVANAAMDLLLLPYHKHKDHEGRWVNGLGVATHLGARFARRKIPVLMPVDDFTFAASYPREYGHFCEAAAEMVPRLVVLREDEIGDAALLARLEQARNA